MTETQSEETTRYAVNRMTSARDCRRDSNYDGNSISEKLLLRKAENIGHAYRRSESGRLVTCNYELVTKSTLEPELATTGLEARF